MFGTGAVLLDGLAVFEGAVTRVGVEVVMWVLVVKGVLDEMITVLFGNDAGGSDAHAAGVALDDCLVRSPIGCEVVAVDELHIHVWNLCDRFMHGTHSTRQYSKIVNVLRGYDTNPDVNCYVLEFYQDVRTFFWREFFGVVQPGNLNSQR